MLAAAIVEEEDIAWELCLSLHAVRDRLARLGQARRTNGCRRRHPGTS